MTFNVLSKALALMEGVPLRRRRGDISAEHKVARLAVAVFGDSPSAKGDLFVIQAMLSLKPHL